MIHICNIRDVHAGEFDEVWAIVRSYNGHSSWIRHVPELSPSWELFRRYRALKANGEWNQDSFASEYVPQFLREMHSPEATRALNQVFLLSEHMHKNIALVCFCPEESLCHRSIIAGLLQGAGAEVIAGKDYSHYYKSYSSAK